VRNGRSDCANKRLSYLGTVEEAISRVDDDSGPRGAVQFCIADEGI
jgi:hypothetical protein